MRVSIDTKSPFYNDAAHYIDVYMNGQRVDHCVEFCTVLGIVWKYYDDMREDAFGNHLIEVVKGNVTFKLTGRAEIVGGKLRLGK